MFQAKRRNAQLGLFGFALVGMLFLAGCPVSVCKQGDITSPGCTCLPNDVRPECQAQTGTIQLNWTVNSEAASTACATAGAVSVRISIDGGTPVTEPCSSGTRSFPSLAIGAKNVVADLLDGSGISLANFTQSVTVLANQTASVDIQFTTSGGGNGSVGFSWTVGLQPASTACPVGSQVQIQSTAGPVLTPVDQSFDCTQGAAQIDNLPAGSYTFKATLLDSVTNPVVDNLMVTVVGGQVAQVSSIDFTVGASTGTAELSITIINNDLGGAAAACASGAQIDVTATPTAGGTGATGQVFCPPTLYPVVVSIPSLPAGNYNFDVVLSNDPNHVGSQATTQVNADIVADQTAQIPATLDCTFCNAQ